MNDSDTFIKELKHTLDDIPVEQNIQQQLKNARHVAVQGRQPSAPSRFRVATIAFASLAVVALAIMLSVQSPDNPAALEHMDAFEIITSHDELEMYENLEFYLWLEDQPMEQV